MSEGFPITVQMKKGDRTFTSDAPALTLIPATDAPMHETSRKYRWFFGGELAVSLLLHTLVAVALTGVVARQFGQPQVDPISVELVAPPELETPESQVPELKLPELEQPKPEVPEPDEKQPPEQKPEEQKPPEQKQEEQKQEEQKQEEKKQEEPKAEQPPPPPPPPSEQKPEQKPEEKPVEPEKQEEPDTSTEPEKKAEPDKTAEEKPAPTVMQPVVEFGESDSGPRKAEDGSAAEEANASEQPEDKPTEPAQAGEGTGVPEEAKKAETDPAETPPTETVDDQEEAQEEPVQPDQTQAEKTEPTSSEAPAPQILSSDEAEDAAPDDFGTVGRIVTSVTPAPKPAQRPAARAASNTSANLGGTSGTSGRSSPRLAEARRLFSDSVLGGQRAKTAMAGMPPGQRLNLLCMTELRAQLIDWDPARPPEMLPSFRPKSGNVLEPGQAAYGSRGEWYDLNFRCETDKEVTRVLKFSFRIGPPIPPAKWQGRGLPAF